MLPAIQGYIRSAIPDTDMFSKVICPENNISPKGKFFYTVLSFNIWFRSWYARHLKNENFFIFRKTRSKWTEFNSSWHAESWRNLICIVLNLSTTPEENVTTLACEMHRPLSFDQSYIVSPKMNGLGNSRWLWCVAEIELQKIRGTAVKKGHLLRWHTFLLVFFTTFDHTIHHNVLAFSSENEPPLVSVEWCC